MTTRQSRPMAVLALTLTALLMTSCDKVTGAMGLTGTVGAVAPQLIGPERLRVSLPKTGALAVLGPVSRIGSVTEWQTLDGITLAFREGVLTGTRGLGNDLMSADVSGGLALFQGVAATEYHTHFRSYLDGEDQIFFRSYQCRQTAAGSDTTGEASVDASVDVSVMRRIGIRCTSPQDSFTNIYWLDRSGTVAKSRQWVSPTIGYMETERVTR